jgi:hypothetical protein
MGNRCFWVSAAELTVHILTDGDCLQSHNNVNIFTRQLQWAMQQCNRHLNHEPVEEATERAHQSVQAVSVQIPGRDQAAEGRQDGSASDFDVDIVKVEACTASTNTSDDYAHRGTKLRTIPLYVYRMYVRRIPRPSRAKTCAPTIFFFEHHYALARSYVQEVILNNINVPTIDGFQCPTVEQDAEQNSLLKAILFTPWSCTDPMMCGSVMNYKNVLSNVCSPDEATGDAAQLAAPSSSSRGAPQRLYTFLRAWRRSEIHVLARRADCRCAAARKKLLMADTILFAENKEPRTEIQQGEETKQLLQTFCLRRLQRSMQAHGMRLILAFLGTPCKWHEEQCTLAEFSAYVARDVMAHVDLAAEARVQKHKKPMGDADSDLESESDEPKRQTGPTMDFVDMQRCPGRRCWGRPSV